MTITEELLAFMALSLSPSAIIHEEIGEYRVADELRVLSTYYRREDLSPRLYRFFTASATVYARDMRFYWLHAAQRAAVNSLYPHVPLATPLDACTVYNAVKNDRRILSTTFDFSDNSYDLVSTLREQDDVIITAYDEQVKRVNTALILNKAHRVDLLLERAGVTPRPLEYLLDRWLDIK